MFKYSIWKLAIVSRSFRLQESAGLNDTYALSQKWEKLLARSDSRLYTCREKSCTTLKARNDGETDTWTSQAEPSAHNARWLNKTYLSFWAAITAWKTHEARTQRPKLCFLRLVALSPNCWSVVADKTSDRYGSLSALLSVCPQRQLMKMHRERCRLEPICLLAPASVVSWLE